MGVFKPELFKKYFYDKTAWILDDDQWVIDELSIFFNDYDMKTRGFNDKESFWEAFQKDCPNPSTTCFLLDLCLQGDTLENIFNTGGYQIIRQLSEQQKSYPTLVLSNFIESKDLLSNLENFGVISMIDKMPDDLQRNGDVILGAVLAAWLHAANRRLHLAAVARKDIFHSISGRFYALEKMLSEIREILVEDKDLKVIDNALLAIHQVAALKEREMAISEYLQGKKVDSKRTNVDIVQWLQQWIDKRAMIRHEFAEISVVFDEQSGQWPLIYGNNNILTMVFENLFANAYEAMQTLLSQRLLRHTV